MDGARLLERITPPPTTLAPWEPDRFIKLLVIGEARLSATAPLLRLSTASANLSALSLPICSMLMELREIASPNLIKRENLSSDSCTCKSGRSIVNLIGGRVVSHGRVETSISMKISNFSIKRAGAICRLLCAASGFSFSLTFQVFRL